MPPWITAIRGHDNKAAVSIIETAINFLGGIASMDLNEATNFFMRRFPSVDQGTAIAFVTALKEEFSTYVSDTEALDAAFCSRSYADGNAWAAAMTALEAQYVAARVGIFNRMLTRTDEKLWPDILQFSEMGREQTAMFVTDYYIWNEYEGNDYRRWIAGMCD